METNYAKAFEIVNEQERLLQFPSFNCDDAWKLGQLMVEETKKRSIDMAIAIRKMNGHVVFQYASEKANLNHQNWMRRKFNMVCYLECSSLRCNILARNTGKNLTTFGLNDEDYKLCGGGFPIRVKGSGIAMVVTVSFLEHEDDHQFIVDCLSKYLGVEVPPIDMKIEML